MEKKFPLVLALVSLTFSAFGATGYAKECKVQSTAGLAWWLAENLTMAAPGFRTIANVVFWPFFLPTAKKIHDNQVAECSKNSELAIEENRIPANSPDARDGGPAVAEDAQKEVAPAAESTAPKSVMNTSAAVQPSSSKTGL